VPFTRAENIIKWGKSAILAKRQTSKMLLLYSETAFPSLLLLLADNSFHFDGNFILPLAALLYHIVAIDFMVSAPPMAKQIYKLILVLLTYISKRVVLIFRFASQ
jgi:hypothetical protein